MTDVRHRQVLHAENVLVPETVVSLQFFPFVWIFGALLLDNITNPTPTDGFQAGN